MTNSGIIGFPQQPDGKFLRSGVAFPSGYLRSGAYYITAGSQAQTPVGSLGNGTLRVLPWIVPNSCTLTRIGASVTITGESNSKVRLGLYADDGTGYPGALIFDAGTIAGDSSTVQEIAINQALTAGLYWIGGAVQAAPSSQPTVTCVNTGTTVLAPLGAQPTATQQIVGVSMTSVSGALPAVFSTTVAATGFIPRVFVKIA